MTEYFDIWELGERLDKNPSAIKKLLRNRPWELPPRLYIPGSSLLRWRRKDVEVWIQEQEALYGDSTYQQRGKDLFNTEHTL